MKRLRAVLHCSAE